jgi:hypothetical protein
VPTAIQEVERRLAVDAAVNQARDRANDEGLQFVEPADRMVGLVAWRRLDADSEVAAARALGRLAGGCEPSGQFVYLEAAKAPTELGLTEQARLATDSRRSAARQLVNTRPSARAVSEALTDVVLFGRFDQDRALKLTQQWIGDSVGITTRDPRQWRDSLKSEDRATRGWVAWALTIAATEIDTDGSPSWGEHQRDYLRLLHEKVGYSPTEWEHERLAGSETSPSDSGGITSDEAEQAS